MSRFTFYCLTTSINKSFKKIADHFLKLFMYFVFTYGWKSKYFHYAWNIVLE